MRKLADEMLEDGSVVINAGPFEIGGKQYGMVVELKEEKRDDGDK